MLETSASQPATGAGPGDPVLADIERAMIRIRRRQSRRALGKHAVENLPHDLDLQQMAVVDAIDEGAAAQADGVTVGQIAERLGIDPSRASRLVSATIASGFIRRTASQQDGRRICLELTASGRDVVQNAHRNRQALYGHLLRDWDPADRAEFARLLTRFTDALADAEHPA
ncbi:MarR family transcriptional regulator [Actinoplanes sp. NPDC049316]|uniref:MarR family winged helix-turn-helix transcriptional regulator n=1 Tax=Actinoplanes sp. NPDC049316 TaxID=3154727 RepID=UPI003428BB82